MPGQTVARLDIGNLTGVRITPQGYLKAPAYATRVGVFTYKRADGTEIRELRHPDEVFKADSMETLGGIPVTNDHPPTIILDSANTREFQIGYTADTVAKESEKYLKTAVTITDKDAIACVKAGKCELSCGYTCELDAAPGTFDGKPYDFIQRNITYNHLAIVAKGRAGPSVRLRLDSTDAAQVVPEDDDKKSNGNGAKTMKITLDGKEYEVGDDVGKAVTTALQAATDREKSVLDSLAIVKRKYDQAEARADSLKVQLENTEKTMQDRLDATGDKKRIAELVKARKALEVVAARALNKEVLEKLDSMDDKTVKLEIIKAESPKVNLEGRSDDYVEALYDHIAATLVEKKVDTADIGKKLHDSRADGAIPDSEAAKKRQQEYYAGLWQTDFKIKSA